MQRIRLLETLTNVALLIACVAVTGLAITRYVSTSNADVASSAAFRHSEGEVVRPPEPVTFASHERTALLFLSSQCRFCTESMPFYAELSKVRRSGQLQLVAAGYEEQRSLAEYVAAHGVAVDHAVSIEPGHFKFPGTPSIVLVDSSGRVLGQWNGALRGREEEVLSRIGGRR